MENDYLAKLAIYRRSIEKNIQSFNENRAAQDSWGIDAPIVKVGAQRSYDCYFRQLLLEEGALTFQGWLRDRKDSGSSTNVLDLFGNGYFIEDLTTVDSITGMRISNVSNRTQRNLRDELRLDRDSLNLTSEERRSRADTTSHALRRVQAFDLSEKCDLVTGNLYSPATWRKLDETNFRKGITSYDLITAKPEGAIHELEIFHDEDKPDDTMHSVDDINQIYALQFLRLADNAYTRLNPDGGMFVTEVPGFIAEGFLHDFTDISRREGSIEVSVTTSHYKRRKNLKLIKKPHSAPNLTELVRPHFRTT